ncbi:basic salivary proline-rich protein 2-like [Apodemus sylvaticus]|uniref:basic salivary proline-rich protein 2-like n=1 Tax=Apodemus sylvaticus TaxID=10129 RepID=UPI002241EC90|nr:basic salivary proline-rich protein 2-like [Apodemus sylvaticus]
MDGPKEKAIGRRRDQRKKSTEERWEIQDRLGGRPRARAGGENRESGDKENREKNRTAGEREGRWGRPVPYGRKPTGPTHTQPEGRSCQTDGLTEGSPRGESDPTASLPTPSAATQGPPDAAGDRGGAAPARPLPSVVTARSRRPDGPPRRAGRALPSPPPTPWRGVADALARSRLLPPAPSPASGRHRASGSFSSLGLSLRATSSPSFFLRPRRRRLCQPPCASQRAIPRPPPPATPRPRLARQARDSGPTEETARARNAQ